MKKILVVLIALLSTISVQASSFNPNVLLEDIELKNYSIAAYEGVLEIEYKLVPLDADDKNVTWSISGVKDGVSAIFKDGNVTKTSSGKMKLELKNTTNEVVTLVLNVKSGKISKSVEIKLENKNTTEDRVREESIEKVEELITNLPTKVTKDNYEEVRDSIMEIKRLLEENDIEDEIESSSLDKYEIVNEELTNFERNGNTGTIIIVVILVLSFVLGLYLIFKKEEN